ncbi:MAG: DUF2635 domain-containing protein [Rhizobiales bacterium]|nr:DUF2635 domain-containing protein [Hyphomicrobiales bacterium]
MAEKKWFIPAEGCTVRDPNTRKIVPAEGMEVEDSIYWRRRVNAHDGSYGSKPAAPGATKAVKKDNANG